LKKPELLAPAGNLEKVNIALAYGADAVYVGCRFFGLRKYSENLSLLDLEKAVNSANKLGKKIYLTLNSFPHNQDLEELTKYLPSLNKIKPHAFIVSDLGVLKLIQENSEIPVHISTQASVLNSDSVNFWQNQGAKRIILAREVSIKEIKNIKTSTNLELETFIHGAMCAGYSGKCVISNYTSQRDANRGGCVQNCRHKYNIKAEKPYSAHIMNSKDLMAVSLLPKLIEAGIDSFKIEGRMKSNMYVATATGIYRKALDKAYELIQKNQADKFYSNKFEHELAKVSNRTFSSGSFLQRPPASSMCYNFTGYQKQVEFMGTVKKVKINQYILIDVKNPFKKGDSLEFFCKNTNSIPYQADKIFAMDNSIIETTKPNSLIKIPWQNNINQYDILRRCFPI
jgi:U32 family peptidase